MGEHARVKKLKEDMGILAYMRRQNMENQTNKGVPELMIKEFQESTACHPSLISRVVIPEQLPTPQ